MSVQPGGQDVARRRHEEVADDLRRRIRDGEWGRSGQLPSEALLAAGYQASRLVIRDALKQLRLEGLVVTQPRAGTRVANTQATVIDLHAGLRPPPLDETVERLVHYQVCEVAADDRVAQLLRVDHGAPVMHRRSVVVDNGEPAYVADSYLPQHLAAAAGGQGSTVQRLADIGVRVTAVTWQARVRPATREEAAALQLVGQPDAVLALTRVTFAGDQVVEAAADIIHPAHRAVIVCETRAEPDPGSPSAADAHHQRPRVLPPGGG